MGEEENLDRYREAGMEHDNNDQEDFADLAIRGAQYRIQVAQKKGYGQAEANSDKGPVENLNGRPADDSHRDPYEVGVSVKSPALEKIR